MTNSTMMLQGELTLSKADCWASVGFTSSKQATMVGGDFIVGERDGKTQQPVVRAYGPDPKGNTAPIARADQSSVAATSAEMGKDGSKWSFERELAPADLDVPWLVPGADVGLIWATCDWNQTGQDAIYLCHGKQPDANCSAHGWHGMTNASTTVTPFSRRLFPEFAAG